MKEIINDDWRKWIAENVLLGTPRDYIILKLKEAGFLDNNILAELENCISSPYTKAAELTASLLKKREWLLLTQSHLLTQSKDWKKIPKIAAPTYQKFLDNYYYKNFPCIIKNAVNHWPALKWTPELLLEKLGYDTELEVTAGRQHEKNYEINRLKYHKMMKFGDFVKMIRSVEVSNDFYITANNKTFSNPKTSTLIEDLGNVGDGYLDMSKMQEQAFFWLGPKGTITLFHHDLTNNFFVQLHGRKRFRLIPSSQVPLLGNYNHVYTDLKLEDIEKIPGLKIYDITVGPGECLFIPIGWWHHVVALDISITMTFTNLAKVSNYFPGHSA